MNVGKSSHDRILSPCVTCQHKDLGVATCSAYPFGIPKDILSGQDRHTQSRGDDAGITYQPLADISTTA
jgi:hypothetical protein